jgi:hypothetical protein
MGRCGCRPARCRYTADPCGKHGRGQRRGTARFARSCKLYLRDVVADVTRPLPELADRVSLVLDAGAVGTATFRLTPEQLSCYDRTMTLRIDPGEAVVTVGPDASSGLSARITVTG